MVTLSVRDLISDFSNNNASGEILFQQIKNLFENQESVVVSFQGISDISSSFVNSAFIDLLNEYDFDYIRKNLKFINSTKQINSLIKDRFTFEVKKTLVNA
ncbi:STAS-like domain-containing protein [Lactococcus garvieae]|uniref:STAS-like domain-containing protein n=1 Tax=Lactococcus garvieae TaxID=1363 RepID=A0AA46YR71_9LACT|nr:STAS-like domain-containing protein [Lactococcus garvieae]UYT10740.1 STAS-like domain-containing protein [Lactococcus garvieae]UYT12782.1 STAS-like domain-containing protein [Lactococcus garvieae]